MTKAELLRKVIDELKGIKKHVGKLPHPLTLTAHELGEGSDRSGADMKKREVVLSEHQKPNSVQGQMGHGSDLPTLRRLPGRP